MNQPAYFAIIPASIRYDAAIVPNAKLLYGEITALCNLEGFCWAENAYFANLYNKSTGTISRWISSLERAGYITVEINKIEGNTRKIAIDENVNTSRQKTQYLLTKKSIPIDKKRKSIKENNTINNTMNNTMNREGNALDFLSTNYATRFEAFCMQHKSKLGNEWQAFVDDYNCKVIEEKLDWDADVLFARLTRLSNNWQRHPSAAGGKKEVTLVVNKPSGQKIEYIKRN